MRHQAHLMLLAYRGGLALATITEATLLPRFDTMARSTYGPTNFHAKSIANTFGGVDDVHHHHLKG